MENFLPIYIYIYIIQYKSIFTFKRLTNLRTYISVLYTIIHRFSTKQPGRQNTTVQEAATTIGSGNKSSTTKATTNSAEASSWTRRSCSAINSVADAGNDSVDSNKSAPCSPCLTESFLPGYEEGRRQPRRRVCVTLGQLRGLEEPPQPTLTAGEWRYVWYTYCIALKKKRRDIL